MTSIRNDIRVALSREWLLLRRQSTHLINGFCFFLLVGLIYQIMLGPNLVMPQGVGLCVLWILSLLSILLIAEGWLATDLKSGFYEIWLSQGRSLWLLFAVKLFMQWLVIAMLMLCFVPIVGFQIGIDMQYIPLTLLAMVISSLAMVCFCGFGVAVTAGQTSGGLLTAILVLPLNIPPMIFGAGAVMEQMQAYDYWPVLMLLTAISLGAIMLIPAVMGFSVKILVE